MDLQTLLERAKKLVPEIEGRALETEQLRQMPQANVEALISSGLTRAQQPASFGGSGLGCRDHIAITRTLARGCVSTAWCQFVWSEHNYLMTAYPERAQAEVWSNPEVLIAGSLIPTAQAQRVDGGFRLSGHWSFASGCDAAKWLLLGATTEGAGQPEALLCLLPRAEVEIIDNWHVSGLKGSGSKDCQVTDAFVPEHRAPSWNSVVGRFAGSAYTVVAGPVLGAAEAAVERFEKRLQSRVLITKQKQQEMGGARKRLSESAAEVDAAALLLERAASEVDAHTAANSEPSPLELARWKRDIAFCAELCTCATQRVFEASGGGALQESEPIQRIWRDVNAGHSHAILAWDAAADDWANALLASPRS